MIHNNCENSNFEFFQTTLRAIEVNYSWLFHKLAWISLGGGVLFTQHGYPLDLFAQLLKEFKNRYNLEVYLEPGEAIVHNCGTLEVSVLDILDGSPPKCIVDASIESHFLDLLIYRYQASIEPNSGPYSYQIAGRSCLAGDIFGTFNFQEKLEVGSRISIKHAAAYSLVKKNWFNGLSMPSLVLKHHSGELECILTFNYHDFIQSHGCSLRCSAP